MEETQKKLELITTYFSDFTPLQLQQFGRLEELYNEWNSRINVISRKDIDALFEKHILHSLSIAAIFNFPTGIRVIDIGTGGGFPGIPLAIFYPDAQFHLVDSIGKKIKVVNAIAGELGLNNVTASHERAEAITNRKFDVAVSRAVAPLGELWKWAKPLLNKQAKKPDDPFEEPHGLICLKGGDLSAEIAESGTRPRMVEIHEVFPREYFREKYMLFVEV